ERGRGPAHERVRAHPDGNEQPASRRDEELAGDHAGPRPQLTAGGLRRAMPPDLRSVGGGAGELPRRPRGPRRAGPDSRPARGTQRRGADHRPDPEGPAKSSAARPATQRLRRAGDGLSVRSPARQVAHGRCVYERYYRAPDDLIETTPNQRYERRS